MLGHILRKSDHRVVSALNGQEALARLAEEPFELVISDITMPEMDGLELLRRIRANEQFKHLPIIMVTASGQDQDCLTARAEGANAFLTKPTGSRELIETVNQVLRAR
jgi:CheY-like chemotaxis protein